MNARPVLRRCVSCRQLLDRSQLWRVIRLAGGSGPADLALDRGMGRSAYLCPRRECLEEARRRKRLQKALRCGVADSIFQRLEQRLTNGEAPGAEAR